MTNVINDINHIAQQGREAIEAVHDQRAIIMEAVKQAAKGEGNSKLGFEADAKITNAKGESVAVKSEDLGALEGVDIATGAGALVLDDALQELSTIEQAAAQLVAAENKAQKQVHSVTGQG